MERLALLLLRVLLSPTGADVREVISEVKSGSNAQKKLDLVARWLNAQAIALETRLKLNSALVSSIEETTHAKLGSVRSALRRNLDARKSALYDEDVWIKRLGLPQDAFKALLSIDATAAAPSDYEPYDIYF
jgi:hypothetical protein